MKLGMACAAITFTCLTAASLPAQSVYRALDYGVLGTAHHIRDGASISGSSVITSSCSAAFSNSDVGQPIIVAGAGPNQSPIISTIRRVFSPSSIDIGTIAALSETNASVAWGPDDTQAIQQLIQKVSTAGGGTIYFPAPVSPAGVYRVSSGGFVPALTIRSSNIRITGDGADKSTLFNSSITFSTYLTSGGGIWGDQLGSPVLYVNAGAKAIPASVSNVQVDNIGFEDNGQSYNYLVVGPQGPGAIGTQSYPDGVSTINNFTFRNLAIRTNYLVGINIDSAGDTYLIESTSIVSSGNHLMYLAGSMTNGQVTDNTLLGGTVIGTGGPRIGVAVKESRLLVANNIIDHVQFAGVMLGESPNISVDGVTVKGNVIRNLTPAGSAGIFISWASNTVATGNTISQSTNPAFMLWTAKAIANATITGNILSHDIAPISQRTTDPGATITNITFSGNTVIN